MGTKRTPQMAERRKTIARTFALLRLERRIARQQYDKVAEVSADRAIRAVQCSWRRLRHYGVV